MSILTPSKVDVTFNGHQLTQFFLVHSGGISRPLMGAPTLTTTTVEGRNGIVVTGTRMDAYDVTVTFIALRKTPEDLHEAFLTLASWLTVDEACPLAFSDEDGRYRMAWPSGVGDITERGLTDGYVDVTFRCYEGCQRGKTWTKDSTSGVVDIDIKGSIAAPLTLTSDAASGDWTVRDEDGNLMSFACGSGSKRFVVDTEAGSVLVGGIATMLTLDSDWLTLAPGKHTLTRTSGSGEFSVTYTERWAG